jgi:hypothetical protein
MKMTLSAVEHILPFGSVSVVMEVVAWRQPKNRCWSRVEKVMATTAAAAVAEK